MGKFSVIIGVLSLLLVVVTGKGLGYKNQYHDIIPEGSPVGDVPVECLYCEAVVFAFETDIVPKVNNETEMVALVTKLCMKILNQTAECKVAGKALGHELWIIKNLSPVKACSTLLNMTCPGREVMGKEVNEVLNSVNLTCSLCKDVVSAVKFFIIANENWIAKEIISLVCDHLPEEPAQACTKAITEDLPELLEKYLDPDQICGLVHLC